MAKYEPVEKLVVDGKPLTIVQLTALAKIDLTYIQSLPDDDLQPYLEAAIK